MHDHSLNGLARRLAPHIGEYDLLPNWRRDNVECQEFIRVVIVSLGVFGQLSILHPQMEGEFGECALVLVQLFQAVDHVRFEQINLLFKFEGRPF